MAIIHTFSKKKDVYVLTVSQDTDYTLYKLCGTKQSVVEFGDIISQDTQLFNLSEDGKYRIILKKTGESDVTIDFTVTHNLMNSIILDIQLFLSCNIPTDECCTNTCYSSDVKEYLNYKDLFIKLEVFKGLYFNDIAESLSNAFTDFTSDAIAADRCKFQNNINKILKAECIYGSSGNSPERMTTNAINSLIFETLTLYYYGMYFIEKNLAGADPDELAFIEDKFNTDTIPGLIQDTTCAEPDQLEDIFDNALTGFNTKPTVDNTIITPANNLPANLFNYTFQLADFTNNFTDIQGDNPKNIKFGLLPVRGTLKYNGVPVSLGTVYSLANVNKLVYSTTIDVAQANYDNILFQVSDDNVIELYSDMANVTINTAGYINQPISQLGNLVLNKANRENVTFSINDFTTNLTPPYVDPEGDSLDAIRVDSLPATGQLRLNGNPVNINDIIPASSISGGLFVFIAPAQDASASSSFTFAARDSGSLQWVT